MEKKLDYNFTAVPTNLMLAMDINCRTMLFTLCQLASYFEDKEGKFFRTNADLSLESKLSQKLVIATIDTLYQHGIIDVISVGKGNGKHANFFRINYEKFKEYEQYSMDELKNPTLHINTVEGYNRKGYSPSYLKNNSDTLPEESQIVSQEFHDISPIIPPITNNKYNIENKENVNNKEIKEDISNNINNNIIIEEKEEDKHIRILESLRGEGVKVSDVLSKLAKEHWDTYVYFKNDLKKSENEKIKRVYWNNRELIEELNEKYSPKNQTYQIA